MTLQASHIKPIALAPNGAGAVRNFARAFAAAMARRRDRINQTSAFRRWMTHERALEDMGLANTDNEPSAFCDFGFVSTMFQNRIRPLVSRPRRDRT